MAHYLSLSREVTERIVNDRAAGRRNPYAFRDEDVIRRDPAHDHATLWRPAFVRDIEKIMHVPFYSRYMDKTQVFSLVRNDDVSRRALHVQLVSRVARNIGSLLGLNVDLIEAISLGHDIGHTPFGHAGEKKLSELYHAATGRYFNHNIHSARVLDEIFPLNLSLQTLDGIICHNGEMEAKRYEPEAYSDFATFDAKMESCYLEEHGGASLVPNTLEGCVMRISDIIAYLGKDRQDALRLGFLDNPVFADGVIGTTNAEIINNMIVNIVENSYGEPYLKMDDEYFEALSVAKKENYEKIYKSEKMQKVFEETIHPMFEMMFEELLREAKERDDNSLLFKHHIRYIEEQTAPYADNGKDRSDPPAEGKGKIRRNKVYRDNDPADLVVDYMAGMTDDYFVDCFHKLFPESGYGVEYKGYFKQDAT